MDDSTQGAERPEDMPDERSDALAADWLADRRAARQREREAQQERRAEPVLHDETCRHEDDEVQPCGHTHTEHVEMGDEVMAGHSDGIGRLLAGVLGVDPSEVRLLGMGPMPQPEPETPKAPDMDLLLANLRNMEDVHAAILGASIRHKDACEAAGFSPAAAEGLAFQFYQQALGK